MKNRVLVLGSTGMLGYQVLEQLRRQAIDAVGTSRQQASSERSLAFDAETDDIEHLIESNGPFDYIVNAIGVIKPYIHDGNPVEEQRAIRINSIFPNTLAEAAQKHSVRVIQIATDCVYSGNERLYSEAAAHDALDTYGKSKSLGEVKFDNVMHIRCSIIGREVSRSSSLVQWVLGHEQGATVTGYTNHVWNGVTTNVFGRVCAGIINQDLFIPGVFHLVPSTIVTKFELVEQIALACGRPDLHIVATEAGASVDRTLSTNHPEVNRSLWSAAGFENVPCVEEIVATLAEG